MRGLLPASLSSRASSISFCLELCAGPSGILIMSLGKEVRMIGVEEEPKKLWKGEETWRKTGLGWSMPDFEDHLYYVTCCFRSLMAGTWYLHPASQEEISPSDLKELTQPRNCEKIIIVCHFGFFTQQF